MGKISPVSAKYIVHTSIQISGVVDKPDIIGAVFGQTEGLLGTELELRELQKNGRLGRIEVDCETRNGKTEGAIIIPSSLDKTETVIIAAALETIQRIGPCNAKVKVESIEDVRISKRQYIIGRAKELLKTLQNEVLPDSQEITDEVAFSVRMMEVTEYGKDRLPAGPGIDESEEVIVVEGRADVLNLLKQGFKNVIALNGTNTPDTIKELSKGKTITLFVDGDRGGDLIIREVCSVAEVDFVAKAPDGKEVEEITKKEIHKALRAKVAMEQAQMEVKEGSLSKEETSAYKKREEPAREITTRDILRDVTREARKEEGAGMVRDARRMGPSFTRPQPIARPQPIKRVMPSAQTVSKEQKSKFKELLEDLTGTRGAYILDESLNILGKVPTTELPTTIKSLSSGIFAIVFDGKITRDLVLLAEKSNINCLVGMTAEVYQNTTKIQLITSSLL
ncbi:DNA primase [Candidatus Woesearchaeota archaeon]|nr:DNA primase [Candidatus Woesearchaeota archaeon]